MTTPSVPSPPPPPRAVGFLFIGRNGAGGRISHPVGSLLSSPPSDDGAG
eukprot:CAMPEP_0183309700 /NCGR_PEP_ID=MMETSP0160_2-20130417/25497_1 /TAXON_ID=2839 ORGANISM="Odontella Sinensis, Strain Grunow 1884" /NCGR_SAMPLE_ID=MMETSP0160_2 /ASSEMBLY_ACC=CAM_ASM_000250 /LENGTH=48 /DNA_ID= /DNA_START= /DNA_END= /DNA_ORIENTATION=